MFPNQSLWWYLRCDRDSNWIYCSHSFGSSIIVHDGLYIPKMAKVVCSSAFTILCTHACKRVKGTVVEKHNNANIHQGEILNRLDVNLVLCAGTQGMV